MSSRIEETRHIEPRELARRIQTRAEFALDQMRSWLPALNTKTAGSGVIAGMLGLMSIACSPTPEPTPTPAPIVRVESTPAAGSPRPPEPPIGQKEVAQRKAGIYVKTLALEQTDTPVRNHLIYTQLPVTKVIDIEAVDPQNNAAGFGFVETTDNQPRVVFRTPDNNAVSFSYTSAATVDVKDQKVSVEYLTTHDKFTFLRFGLNKTIPKQAGETDERYKERVTKLFNNPSYQQEIIETLGNPEQIEQVFIANPYADKTVSFDLKKVPNLLGQLLAAFSPKTAYAQSLPPRPTPAPTEVPKAVQKPPEPPPAKKVGEEGKIEVKQPEEWEKYFTPVTAEEAEKLLAEANANAKSDAEFKLLLPFDPRQSKGIIIETVEFKMPGGIAKVIGIKNIASSTSFYAPISGEAKFYRGAAVGGTLAFSVSIKQAINNYGLTIRREGSKILTSSEGSAPVKIGTPLLQLGNREALGFYPGDQQIILEFYRNGSKVYASSVPQLLTKAGKIVFIPIK